MTDIQSLDVVLPTDAEQDICLRTFKRPEQQLAILLERLKLPPPIVVADSQGGL